MLYMQNINISPCICKERNLLNAIFHKRQYPVAPLSTIISNPQSRKFLELPKLLLLSISSFFLFCENEKENVDSIDTSKSYEMKREYMIISAL
jgi:hypothetical protein